MIGDGMFHPAEPHPVECGAGELAREDADVAHDDVLAASETEAVFSKVDPFAGRGLARDVEFALIFANGERPLQRDQPRDSEHDRARPAVRQRLRDSVAKAPRPTVVQVGYLDDAPAAAAARKSSITFGSWEGEVPLAELPKVALGDAVGGVHFVHAPIVREQAVEIRYDIVRAV